MERFVRLVVGGGVVLVASLWVLEATVAISAPWAAGLVLSAVGVVALATGITIPLDR